MSSTARTDPATARCGPVAVTDATKRPWQRPVQNVRVAADASSQPSSRMLATFALRLDCLRPVGFEQARALAVARACFAVKSVATPSVVFDGGRADPAGSCQPPHVLIRPPRDADLLRFQCD